MAADHSSMEICITGEGKYVLETGGDRRLLANILVSWVSELEVV
jgi:hypothetical protein